MQTIIKNLLRPFYRAFKNYQLKKKFEYRISKHKSDGIPLKIVIGSSGKFEEGWIPSEKHFLDLLDESTWSRYFKENEIDCLLAEHVWEHLTIEEGSRAALICYKYLKSDGWLRLAVPDGYHDNQKYLALVKPGGHGMGSEDHKVLYNYQTLSSIFQKAGFVVKCLEYFDEKKKFHFNEWARESGYVRRSIRYDFRNRNGITNYTSIILDAVKTS